MRCSHHIDFKIIWACGVINLKASQRTSKSLGVSFPNMTHESFSYGNCLKILKFLEASCNFCLIPILSLSTVFITHVRSLLQWSWTGHRNHWTSIINISLPRTLHENTRLVIPSLPSTCSALLSYCWKQKAWAARRDACFCRTSASTGPHTQFAGHARHSRRACRNTMLNSPKTQGWILTRTYDEQVTLGSWGSWKKSKGTSVKADSPARWTARNIR